MFVYDISPAIAGAVKNSSPGESNRLPLLALSVPTVLQDAKNLGIGLRKDLERYG
jgi:hypothetical protein